LVLAGKFVFISGRLLVAGILVLPLLAPLMLELVADVSVELLGVFWLQPASASAARIVIADSEIIDFISLLSNFRFNFLDVAGKRCPVDCVRDMGCSPHL
jgi:hypothetical protein